MKNANNYFPNSTFFVRSKLYADLKLSVTFAFGRMPDKRHW